MLNFGKTTVLLDAEHDFRLFIFIVKHYTWRDLQLCSNKRQTWKANCISLLLSKPQFINQLLTQFRKIITAKFLCVKPPNSKRAREKFTVLCWKQYDHKAKRVAAIDLSSIFNLTVIESQQTLLKLKPH